MKAPVGSHSFLADVGLISVSFITYMYTVPHVLSQMQEVEEEKMHLMFEGF